MSPVLDAPTSYLSEPPVANLALVSLASASRAGSEYSCPALRMTVPTNVATARWFRPVVSRLEGALSLAPGWDSYSALPTTATEVEAAILFLASFLDHDSAPPTIVPLPDGGIQLEWHRGGVDVEATFPVAEDAELYIRDIDSGEEVELNPHESASAQLQEYVDRLRS